MLDLNLLDRLQVALGLLGRRRLGRPRRRRRQVRDVERGVGDCRPQRRHLDEDKRFRRDESERLVADGQVWRVVRHLVVVAGRVKVASLKFLVTYRNLTNTWKGQSVFGDKNLLLYLSY